MTFGKDAPPLPMYERKVLKHVPTMVRRRYDRDLDNKIVATKDLPSEDGESKCGDGAEDDNPASFSDVDDLLDDEAEDESHPHFDDEHDTRTCTKDFGYSDFEPSIYSEGSKSKSGGAEDVNFASIMNANVDEKIEDNGDTELDNDQGICSEDCKDEDDGAIDANTLEVYVDANVKSVVQNNEHGLHVDEDNKGEDDGTKDANIASDCVDDSAQDEVEDKDHHGNPDNKQDMQMDSNKSEGDEIKDVVVANDCMNDRVQDKVDDKDDGNCGNKQDMQVKDNKSEGDDIKDANVASDHVDDSVQDKVEDKDYGNFDNKQDLQVEDNNIEGDETKYANIACYNNTDESAKDEILDKDHGNFDDKQDCSPEALKKTLEQDGYDLCCPNCKNYITHTMIFRRREDCQQHKTTCYSFLIALFCCIRW